MTGHSTYDTLRHLADSWGLAALVVIYLGLVLWPFRPDLKDRNEHAANMIFAEDSLGGDDNGE